MGLIICDKHGTTGIAAVCPHIRNNVLQGIKSSSYYKLETRFDDGTDLLSWLICQTCLDEFRELGLPENNVLQGYDDFLGTWQDILEQREFMQSVVCGKCLSDTLAR